MSGEVVAPNRVLVTSPYVRSDTQRVSFRELPLAPFGFFGNQFNHLAQASRIDRILLNRPHIGVIDALRL